METINTKHRFKFGRHLYQLHGIKLPNSTILSFIFFIVIYEVLNFVGNIGNLMFEQSDNLKECG